MDELRSCFTAYLTPNGRSFTHKIVFFISVLLLVSFLSELFVLRYYDRKWDTVVEQKASENLRRAIQAFSGIQRETRRVATEVAQHPAVQASLSEPELQKPEVFEFVSRIARDQQVGVEVYDNRAHLIAWEGSSEPPHSKEIQIALAGQLASFVTRSQVFSQLFVVTPVRSDGKILGAVLVRRTTELNYPLNNRLIVSTGITEQLTRELGVQVEFNYSPNASLRKDGRYLSTSLIGIDSSKVGVVSVVRPSKGSYLESVSRSFDTLNAALWVILIGVVCIPITARLKGIKSLFVRSLVVTALIWTIRYTLLWLDVPSSVLHISILDPKYFASKFGGGLAKSIGELFITAVALFVNTIIIGRYILGKDRHTSPWWFPRNAALRLVAAPIAATVVFLLLRGYAATIRSAVYDSTIRYNDPMVIVPSFELAVMAIDLFLLSFCLIGVVVALTSFVISLLSRPSHSRQRLPWLLAGGLYAAIAFVIEVIPSDPLVSLPFHLSFALCVLGFAYYLHSQSIRARPIATVRNFLLAFAFSGLYFFPILDGNVHERDRNRIEAYAVDAIKPADSWLRFIVDEALQGFASGETAAILASRDDDAIDHLAFDRWGKSTAAREGYSCVFAVRDSAGYELSRFSIGGQTPLETYRALMHDRTEARSINIERVGEGANSLLVYSGSVPIKADDGKVLAYAYVVVAATQQALFRGESPSVLRNETHESIESFYRPITVAEFQDGELFTTSTPIFPIGYRLPAAVEKRFSDPNVTSLWFEERVDDKPYETFYIRRPPSPNEIVALGVPQMGLVWHLISILKVAVYYALVVLVFVVGFFVVQWLRGYRYEFKFRDRLLGALLVTAIVPIVVMATYGRQLAKDRLIELTAKRLEKETSTLNVTISQRLQGEEGIVQEALNRNVIDDLANEAGTDFNLYVGNQLQASSRPELYEVGILDKRISGLAFANTALKGKRFYLQNENIGSYQYVVGYRPLVSGSGRIAGIVAVPTLYRLEEVEEEIARRNALIFGVYAVMLFLIIIIATTLANRIATPIHLLTVATKRVARGDTNVKVGVKSADGEIGELIRSFETMTRELARSREELVRAERELAWKEMAKQVAHEIKNPLTPMKLSMQHLRQTYRDKVANFGQVFDDVSRTIIEQIDTLSKIAGEFARFARMPKSNLEPVDLNGVLRESIALFEQDAGVHFEVELDENLPPVKSDREELRRAFINIIRNGIQAMSNNRRMAFRTRSENGMAVATLRDHGAGMSDDVKAKLFQPNFSTKTDGMGLGLAITKKSIDDVGGSITVESVIGKGTTVTISIPLHTSL